MTSPLLSQRVVLLLDLDCFYAQCECRRLGYDSLTTPLALLQWNTVLAITYPGRKFNIGRGDSWTAVDEKSKGACLGISVAILETQASNGGENAMDSITQSYESIYEINTEQQMQNRQELGVRRFSHEGKACIERYRIASQRIFATVIEWIEAQGYGKDIVLERASIDEFFLDVTKACRKLVMEQPADRSPDTAVNDTFIVGNNSDTVDIDQRAHDVQAMRWGCWIAQQIRQTVSERVGFTLSAGIAGNKTVAKLSASYGKPNGQAVTFLAAVQHLYSKTQVKKCRNFGGKLGQQVLALLPPEVPTTLASLAQLPLPTLQERFDHDIALWVYKAARGIDDEAVVSKNESAVNKSITCFKSLPFAGGPHKLDTVVSWFRLLAHELVTRVEKDTHMHDRYPKVCTVAYASGINHQRNKSVRIPFPMQRMVSDDKIAELCDAAPKAIIGKEGRDFRVHRIGLCASDFCSRDGKNGIDTYFSTASSTTTADEVIISGNNGVTPETTASVQETIESASFDALAVVACSQTSDMELARKLQTDYDRENRLHEAFERRKQGIQSDQQRRPAKARKIDAFFGKR